MAACCCTSTSSTAGINKFFSRWSKRYAKRFRKKGLEKAQKYLLEGVKRESIEKMKILDIGCGVGSLHLTLLQEGAERSVGVDISEGMLGQARTIADDLGLKDRTTYILGDFVDVADSVPDADVTMLDKVVCCYENLPALLEKSTEKTKYVYALSHPKENFVVRTVFKTQIALGKLLRWKFRPQWHDWQQMHHQILECGFESAYENSTIIWQVRVYRRPLRAAA